MSKIETTDLRLTKNQIFTIKEVAVGSQESKQIKNQSNGVKTIPLTKYTLYEITLPSKQGKLSFSSTQTNSKIISKNIEAQITEEQEDIEMKEATEEVMRPDFENINIDENGFAIPCMSSSVLTNPA
jgi:spermidine synthase